MDANGLKQRDESFAVRLKQRDRSVLIEIDRAYSSSLRRLLQQRRGPCFSDADIDEILDTALMTVWLKHDSNRKASVRTFYFNVGHRRLLDRLKRNGRSRAALQAVRDGRTLSDYQDNELPDIHSLRIERRDIDREIKALVAQAVSLLTPRQRLAFDCRFGPGDSTCWAKDLAAEKGRSPQYWRQASDEARSNICKYLTDNGVQYSEEGGHYEIAKARNSAG